MKEFIDTVSRLVPELHVHVFSETTNIRIEISTCTLQAGMTELTVFVIGVAECSLHCTCMLRLYSARKYLVNERFLTRDLIQT